IRALEVRAANEDAVRVWVARPVCVLGEARLHLVVARRLVGVVPVDGRGADLQVHLAGRHSELGILHGFPLRRRASVHPTLPAGDRDSAAGDGTIGVLSDGDGWQGEDEGDGWCENTHISPPITEWGSGVEFGSSVMMARQRRPRPRNWRSEGRFAK